MKEVFWAIIAVLVIATFPLGASADSITSPDGEYQVGITQYGNLYDPTSGIGFKRVSDGVDVLGSGSHREAYGLDTSIWAHTFGYADPSTSGVVNTIVGQASFEQSSAFVRTLMNNNVIQFDQKFAFAANNVLAIQSTVTNLTTIPLPITYRRTVDFGVSPTIGNEIIQVDPYPLANTKSIINGTADATGPIEPITFYSKPNSSPGETRIGDLGASFDAVVGAVYPGQSASFTVYYGLNRPGQSVTDLRKQVSDLGATFQISATSSNTTGDVNSAVLAYGPAIPQVNPVPAPAGLILGVFGVGIVGLSRWVRRSAGNAGVSA